MVLEPPEKPVLAREREARLKEESFPNMDGETERHLRERNKQRERNKEQKGQSERGPIVTRFSSKIIQNTSQNVPKMLPKGSLELVFEGSGPYLRAHTEKSSHF